MRRPLVLAVYLAVAVLWGSTWLVIRIGLEDLPPLLFAGARMALAAALLAPLGLARGGLAVLLAARGKVAVIGLLQVALPYGLMFVAQQWVPSGLSAILFATFPIWIALIAHRFLPGEGLTPRRAASALLGVAGVAVIEAPRLGDLAGSTPLLAGSALLVLASVVVALANVLARRHILAIPPLALTTGQAAVGAVLLLLASLLLERGRPVVLTPTALSALVYLALFGSGLTYVGLYWLLPRIPMAALGVIPLIDTTVAVSLGAAVLGEPVGWALAVGGSMVAAAAVLAGTSRPAAGGQLTERRGASAQSPSRS